MERAPEDDVQRRRVDDEDAEARAAEDAREVVVVADDRLAEREPELGFDGEDLEGAPGLGHGICEAEFA